MFWYHGTQNNGLSNRELKSVLTCTVRSQCMHIPDSSRALKVADFSTDWKPVRDFLLVNNSSLCPISKPFMSSAYWLNYSFWTGYLCLTPWIVVNLWTMDCKIWSHKTRNIILLCSVQYWYTCDGRDYGQLKDFISNRSRWKQDSKWEYMSETWWKQQRLKKCAK